jgi:hypothetical protein
MGSKEQIADVRIYSWVFESDFLDHAAMTQLTHAFRLHLAESITAS